MFGITFSTDPHRFLESLQINRTTSRGDLVRVDASTRVAPISFYTEKYTLLESIDGCIIEFDRPVQASHIRLLFKDATEPPKAIAKYKRQLSQAEIVERLATQKIVFAGCARDCADKIEPTLQTLLRIGNLFSEFRIVLFENDSHDQTLNLLKRAEHSDPRITVIHQTDLDATLPERTERLAMARNTLVKFTLDHYSNFDYLCWADMDGVVGETFSIDGFLSNFSLIEVWDGVFPVTNTFYYDIWALRHETLSANDYHDAIKNCDASLGSDFIVAYHAFLRQTRLQNLPGWLRVDSAFGGMAVYKMASVGLANYLGTENGTSICEHVPYNTQLSRANKKLYINPHFVVTYPQHHTRDRTIFKLFFA